PSKVRQIVINLISNAVKYSPPHGQITLRCGTTPDGVFLEIVDAGSGIAPEQLESVFEPFVQVVDDEKNRDGGVGLGLTIARRLARGMRGDLTVHSTLGTGSTFRLTLPGADRGRRNT